MAKRQTPDLLRPVVGLLLAASLAACGSSEQSSEPPMPPPTGAGATPVPKPPAPEPRASVPLSDLTPLSTPAQVLAEVSQGRTDPFASALPPPPPPRKAPPPPLELPPEFRFTGVVNTAGRTEAIVSYGPLSGSVGRGDVGGLTTELLPPGWSVASISLGQERLTLQADRGRRITAKLDWGAEGAGEAPGADGQQRAFLQALQNLSRQGGAAPATLPVQAQR